MPEQDRLNAWTAVTAIRNLAPVIHNITNYVVMNTTANALLAIGASPVMAHAEEEVVDMVGISSALVINIGTLSREWVRSMFKATEQAAKRGIPIVLDPVGAGATPYRTRTVQDLLAATHPSIIRGNASEIMALCGDRAKTKGVDSTEASKDAVAAAQFLHDSLGSVICISGETDYIVGGREIFRVRNGHPMMTKVTGLGWYGHGPLRGFRRGQPGPSAGCSSGYGRHGHRGRNRRGKSGGTGLPADALPGCPLSTDKGRHHAAHPSGVLR